MDNESPAAYEAFRCYVELPNAKRSVKAAAEALGGSVNTFEEWCTKFQWRARMRAYFAQLPGKLSQLLVTASGSDEAANKAKHQEMVEQQEAAFCDTILVSSSALLQHRLEHHPDDFSVQDISRMMQVRNQLIHPKRNTRGKSSAGNGNTALRQELMAVAQLAREKRLADAQNKPEPAASARPQTPPEAENPPKAA